MMVTFVAQCEKKSLNRTRRVLDSFANRIGSRTWQTVITNEGLRAVKKLLRKTASKNTAVSCHWFRSRSRSELIWIVGNRKKFNEQGVVPVNYTDGEMIMDEIEVEAGKIFANTKKQLLSHHLFAVGCVAFMLIQRLIDDEKLAKVVFVAGCLHDVGKVDPVFQEWLAKESKKKVLFDVPLEGQHNTQGGKFSFEKHPRHNEISLLLYFLLQDASYKKINKKNKKEIQHIIYWHHAKPIRKEEFRKLDSIYKKLKKNVGTKNFTVMFQAVSQILKQIDHLAELFFTVVPLSVAAGLNEKIDEDLIDDLGETALPVYKKYTLTNDDLEDYLGEVDDNARNNLARAVVVTADRLVSGLSCDELTDRIADKTLHELLAGALAKERGLKANILECLAGFEARFPESVQNTEQAFTADKLAAIESVGVLQGPAGCGKTKIALEWAANSAAKKIIWICPRVQVCQGLLKDLTSNNYLPEAKIEINTGEFKQINQCGKEADTEEGQEFSGDVIITTIDQISNAILTHRNVTGLIDFMASHIIFDEFHEYINMTAFNLLFAELVACKKMQRKQAKALLVSATPNYYFVENFLKIDRDDIITTQSFNQSKYVMSFTGFDESCEDESNPLYQQQPASTFVISNTAITAQKSFIDNQSSENALLFHSKFTKADKADLFNKIYNSFKEYGTKKYDILRSGPVVQAALNISCDRMITEFTHAENWLQRLGRLDRFGKNTCDNHYVTAIPASILQGKQNGKCARFLNSLHSLQSAKRWYEYVEEKLTGEPVTLARVYELYRQFYMDDYSMKAVEEDLLLALKRSVRVIENKVLDPVWLPTRKKSKGNSIKIKKYSLRGDNRFVQMAVCKVSSREDVTFPDEYAYEEGALDANLSASVELICGYGDSKQNLLAFMAKKHHNIKGVKKLYNDKILINNARNPEAPVFLSYIRRDLKKVESHPHPYAIYYAKGTYQSIGAISFVQFN